MTELQGNFKKVVGPEAGIGPRVLPSGAPNLSLSLCAFIERQDKIRDVLKQSPLSVKPLSGNEVLNLLSQEIDNLTVLTVDMVHALQKEGLIV